MVQVVSFTGTLAYTCKYRISAVFCRDVSDQLLNQVGLTYTGTTEQTDFSTFLVGTEKVYDFNTCLQYFCRS